MPTVAELPATIDVAGRYVQEAGLSLPVRLTPQAVIAYGARLANKFQIMALLADVKRTEPMLGVAGMWPACLPGHPGLLVRPDWVDGVAGFTVHHAPGL